jgi:hypothetical protein
MIALSLSTYFPAGDLAKIMATVLVVALIAPSAAALAIAGLDRRQNGNAALGNAFVGLGAAVLVLLVVVGLDALIHR